ncbi:MAG: GLPGLI family protein [Bergeyella sp.]
MKKLSALILFLSAGILWAQNTRFIYQVTTTPDSTNAESRKTEQAYLDTNGKKSFFYGENRLKRDSVMERMWNTKNFDRSQMQNFRSNINYSVEKNFEEQNIVFKDRIGRDNYTYTETQPFSWKILPETVTIGEYKTQKAETEYGGRKWTAWFTMDLLYQDGPYKFFGLPGLIVKIQDEKGDYSFDLMQVKKLEEIPTLQQRGQDIKISKDKFRKTYATFQKDPESFMNQSGGMRGGGGDGSPAPPSSRGGNADPSRMKEMREKMQKEIKSNNNPIELK